MLVKSKCKTSPNLYMNTFIYQNMRHRFIPAAAFFRSTISLSVLQSITSKTSRSVNIDQIVKCLKSSAVLQESLGANNSGLLSQLSGRGKVPLAGSGDFINTHSLRVPLKLSNRSVTPWWIFRRTYTTSGV